MERLHRQRAVAVLLTAACSGGGGPSAPSSTGEIVVTIETAGVHVDPDGYTIALDGTPQRAFTATEIRYRAQAAGEHSLELGEVAGNCTVGGANPRTVQVSAGATARTTFQVTCAQVELGIVFVSDRTGTFNVWSMREDGGGDFVRLTNETSYYPVISPDGSRLAYASPRENGPDVFLVNVDGTAPKQLTARSGVDVYPSWSPDGARMAFMSDRDGTSDIFLMNPDGSGVENLTRSDGYENEPDWCANGEIVYTRDKDLYVISASGGAARRLTFDGVTVNTPRWSPSCDRVAFASVRAAGANANPREDLDLYVINADGTGLLRLTDTARFDVSPTWSPDGTRIAFATERDGNSEIYVMSASGGTATNLTRNPANDQLPSWVR